MRYRDAGVDVGRADALKRDIARDVQSTWTTAVRRLEGGFAGVIDWPEGRGRLLAATMDGVGTKLHLALEAGRVADAAADLVYHGANDLLVHGARPLAFLDYVAQSRLDPGVVRDVVAGLARACRETAPHCSAARPRRCPTPICRASSTSRAACSAPSTPRSCSTGRRCGAGDVVLALGSSGLHTNGYSLARRVLASSGRALGDPAPFDVGTEGGGTLADALLQPHRWYGPVARGPSSAVTACTRSRTSRAAASRGT
jgi:phosphoribosylformylglycinamidine cyclo-ligase